MIPAVDERDKEQSNKEKRKDQEDNMQMPSLEEMNAEKYDQQKNSRASKKTQGRYMNSTQRTFKSHCLDFAYLCMTALIRSSKQNSSPKLQQQKKYN